MSRDTEGRAQKVGATLCPSCGTRYRLVCINCECTMAHTRVQYV